MSSTLRVPALALSVRPDRTRVVVAVSGEIDIATVDDLRAAVRELRASAWNDIVLDLRDVELIGSTGLAWLVATTRSAGRDGWSLSLVDGSPAVSRVLELTALRDHFRWTTA